jgi:hypothetical protein
MALDTLLGLGVGFAMAFVYASSSKDRIAACLHDLRARFFSVPRFKELFFSHLLPLAIIGLIFLFLVLTQMPASAFNYHDDFHTYMPRPVRMLQTGSLGGNPFDVLGVDSLGAQAFMQSFFINHFSISYINAFDAIICFVMGLFLLWQMGRRFRIHWACSLASLFVLIAINPQYVNISSLYSGNLMILAIVFACILFAEDISSANNKRALAGTVAVALFLTSLVALKLTFVVFAAVYFAVYFACLLYLSEKKSGMLRSLLFAPLAVMILIAPWILLSLPNYLTALRIALDSQAPALNGSSDGGANFISNLNTVFSLQESAWGGNYLTYSLIALLLALAGIVAVFLLIKSHDVSYRQRLVAVSAACIAAAVSFVANVYLLDPNSAIRYSAPVLTAVSAVTSLLLVRSGQSSQPQPDVKRQLTAYAARIAVLAGAVAVVGSFSGELVNRAVRAYQQRTLLSFPEEFFAYNKEYFAYNKTALGESEASRVLDLQHKIEEDRALLAIMPTPFHLDFSRNPVYTVTEGAFLNPWFDFPHDGDPEAARKYLDDRGIQYVIFEYQGISVKSDGELKGYLQSPYWAYRRIGERGIGFRRVLRYLAENSHLIHTDGRVVVFDIRQKALLPSKIPWAKN